jgi:hypothetical protein
MAKSFRDMVDEGRFEDVSIMDGGTAEASQSSSH